jgi:hypothetical protein
VAERQPWQHQDVHYYAAFDGFGNGIQRSCQED